MSGTAQPLCDGSEVCDASSHRPECLRGQYDRIEESRPMRICLLCGRKSSDETCSEGHEITPTAAWPRP